MTSCNQWALDGADPSYMPNARRAKDFYYWRAPKRAIAAGYSITSVRLPGRHGDGNDLLRARIARDYTREVMRFLNGDDAPKVKPGSWSWLIARYLNDDLSPFQDVKMITKEGYRFALMRWQEAIGDATIEDVNFLELRRLIDSMKRNGRTASYIQRMFRTLRIVVSYGVLIEADGCVKVKALLGEMRIKGSKPRTFSPTPEHVRAVIDRADATGESAFALGITLQWILSLRPADVRGQWARMEKGDHGTGIVRGGFRWSGGLTWDNIDLDAGIIRKTPSKTEDHMPEELEFEIGGIPEIANRLRQVPREDRVGPLIKSRSGLPYGSNDWGKLFRKIRVDLGLPAEFQCRDIRAGAINDAKRAGASPVQIMHQANHASMDTTRRYLRERSQDANDVIRLRKIAASQPTG